jgi:hypothetical protein
MDSTIQNTTTDHDEAGLAITVFIRELVDEAQRDFVVDRRREHRFPLLIPVTVTPVREGASTFAAVTRDVSLRGVSLLHTGPVEDHYLRIQFKPDAPPVVIEVLRRRKVGPLFEIAGKFLPAY